jgi:hypothetical protein
MDWFPQGARPKKTGLGVIECGRCCSRSVAPTRGCARRSRSRGGHLRGSRRVPCFAALLTWACGAVSLARRCGNSHTVRGNSVPLLRCWPALASGYVEMIRLNSHPPKSSRSCWCRWVPERVLVAAPMVRSAGPALVFVGGLRCVWLLRGLAAANHGTRQTAARSFKCETGVTQQPNGSLAPREACAT